MPGGKGTDQAVACGRASFANKHHQNVRASMIGATGVYDPFYSHVIKPVLEASGVSTQDVLEIAGVERGSATIIVEEGQAGEIGLLMCLAPTTME